MRTLIPESDYMLNGDPSHREIESSPQTSIRVGSNATISTSGTNLRALYDQGMEALARYSQVGFFDLLRTSQEAPDSSSIVHSAAVGIDIESGGAENDSGIQRPKFITDMQV
ncbi:hypothetical protein MKX07_008299 [Trichoderma sp. CBMAI-0711]|nr:hypothetical protein MKX07_008299 [Trichoderma sp. CBMAI-0711]